MNTLFISLDFTAGMAITYFILSLLWFTLCLCYWRELQAVQNWLSLLIVLAMIDCAIKYFELVGWNKTGVRSTPTLVMLILVSSLRDAVARLLLLIVSMGYGIVKTSLGTMMYRCIGLAVVYYICGFTQTIVQETSHGDPSAALMYFLQLPITFLNVSSRMFTVPIYIYIYIAAMPCVPLTYILSTSYMYKRMHIKFIISLSYLIISM